MLSPEDIGYWPADIQALLLNLEEDIIRSIVERLAKEEILKETDIYRYLTLAPYEKDLADLNRRIAAQCQRTADEVGRALEEGAIKSYRHDEWLYAQAGQDLPSWDDSRQVHKVLKAVQSRKKEDVLNMSGTIGFITTEGFTDLDQYYRKRVSDGIFATLTGSYDYQTMNRRIIHEMAASGVRVYDFESGATRTIDGHVRTLLRTGLSQISHEITSLNMDTMSACYVEVSAHIGARPSHADWQGGVYYWAEKDKTGDGNQAGLPDFIEVTGYGSGPGLCGWNCRHSFFPYFPGLSERTYSKKDLENIDPPPFEYEGRTYTAYEASQRQRQLERTMRKTRRTIIGYQAAGAPDVKVAEQVIRLRRQREAYRRFSRAADLRPKLERTTVGGYNRSTSSKAVWSHRRAQEQADRIYKSSSMHRRLALYLRDEPIRQQIKTKAEYQKIREIYQRRHIMDDPEYKSGKSPFFNDYDELQKIIKDRKGTGELLFNEKTGKWLSKELIEDNRIKALSGLRDGSLGKTNKAIVHYSKKGYHAVPTHKDFRDLRRRGDND
ncbi:phage minor capsid protein [Peptococcus simiae]|uniref:phage minor capsid protein n=1 Tax=Peptococcus simiae TaxID=1643805 RepID=UPI0039807C2D